MDEEQDPNNNSTNMTDRALSWDTQTCAAIKVVMNDAFWEFTLAMSSSNSIDPLSITGC
jgi:hypothetical protein